MRILHKVRARGLLLAALALSILPCAAQAPPQPYAVIPRDAVSYSGPGRDRGHDLPGSEIRVGLLAPLTGTDQEEGAALVQAAQLAAEDEAATPLPEGRRLLIVPRDQTGQWGKASKEVVRLTFDDQAVAIITALDGGNAHLAEQVGNKVGVPILTLSTDPTTTETNLPWIFRLGPTDSQQARSLARDIYLERRLHRVLLITENDHDGRIGGDEFLKAVRQLDQAPPTEVTVDAEDFKPGSIIEKTETLKAEALVLWTGHETAASLVSRLVEEGLAMPVYLCQKASGGSFKESKGCSCVRHALIAAASSVEENLWVAAFRQGESREREDFEKRYRERTGASPMLAAAQTYDAVRLVAAALRRAGPNRARLRDALAEVSDYSGASGIISFDHAGNDLSNVILTRLP